MEKINICLACDSNYAKYAGVVITSILYNAAQQDNITFFILDGGIEDKLKNEILSLKTIKDCDINFIAINEDLFDAYKVVRTHSYITLPAFYRLKLPSLLPNVDKVIYFDCDFVICDSLKELYETDIEKYLAAGVNDVDKRKVKKNRGYINSGMVLFDLKKMREQKIEEKFVQWTKDNVEKIKLGDQEIINEVLKGKIKIVPDEWNVQSSNFTNRSSYTNHPKAVHILDKAWKYGSSSFHRKFYYKYLQMTPWKLNAKDLKKWTIDSDRDSKWMYFRRKPLFWLRPRFYIAIWETYFNPKNR